MSQASFFWHDDETFGVATRRDRPAQFAGMRTDAELKAIGAPVMHYCRPAPDDLPDPEPCLLSGVLPQHCLERGLAEHAFAATIAASGAKLMLSGNIRMVDVRRARRRQRARRGNPASDPATARPPGATAPRRCDRGSAQGAATRAGGSATAPARSAVRGAGSPRRVRQRQPVAPRVDARSNAKNRVV